jgi:hypothetical protein
MHVSRLGCVPPSSAVSGICFVHSGPARVSHHRAVSERAWGRWCGSVAAPSQDRALRSRWNACEWPHPAVVTAAGDTLERSSRMRSSHSSGEQRAHAEVAARASVFSQHLHPLPQLLVSRSYIAMSAQLALAHNRNSETSCGIVLTYRCFIRRVRRVDEKHRVPVGDAAPVRHRTGSKVGHRAMRSIHAFRTSLHFHQARFSTTRG